MGCGCGKKGKLPTAKVQERWPALINKTYKNVTDEKLYSRNPRLGIGPSETVVLTSEMINLSVRSWIRSGRLELVEA